ncbi:MAG: peptide ABC transporter substrate-binding protein [Pseudomonadota bacterium]
MESKTILSLFLSVSLLGCIKGETNVEQGNREGVLHFGNYGEPQGVDPHVATGVPEHHIIGALFEGLVQKNPNSLAIEPAVAERWTVSDDGRVYTFTIRNNAVWSNGDKVTAADFEWSWWRALQPALASSYVFMYFPIKNAEAYFNQQLTDFADVGIKAIDEKTFRVELDAPAPYFLQLLDHYALFPVHRLTVEKFGEPDESYTRWTRPENIVSNGPFLLDEWRLFKYLSVKKNPNYWDASKVKLNAIRFYPIDKQTTEERMFRAGQLHRTEEVPIDRIPWYRENRPELLKIAPYIGTYLYRINTGKPHLADVRVRQALSMSVDRRRLIDTVLNGLFTPAFSVVPPGLLGYEPPDVFTYDPDKARQLLSDAGYPGGKGYPGLEIQYNTHEQHRKIAIAIQQMWREELGINVRLQNKDWKVYLDDETTGNFDASRGGWIGDYVDPNTFMDIWTAASGVNRTGFSNEEFDRLVLQQAPNAKDHDTRLQIFQEAERLFLEHMPVVPLYTYSSKHLAHPSVKGLYSNYMDYYNFRYVSLVPDSTSGKPN